MHKTVLQPAPPLLQHLSQGQGLEAEFGTLYVFLPDNGEFRIKCIFHYYSIYIFLLEYYFLLKVEII